MGKNTTNLSRQRQRAVSNILGIALGLTMTIGMAGAVTYFVTQETNVLTTQESFILGGPKLTKVGDIQILSLSIKNTGTSVLEDPSITIHQACKNGGTKFNDKFSDTGSGSNKIQIKPGASYGLNHEISLTSCADVNSGAEPNIEIGESYIVDVKLIAVGTESEIRDTITVTARS